MKVGIINFHCAHNYGAMLQAYALQEEINKYTNNVKIIDFQPKEIMFGYELYNPRILMHPRRTVKTILDFKNKKNKYDVFEKFKNEYMKLTDKKYKSSISTNEFDYIVCGSDQIWNMDLNGGLKEYLLSFANENTKRISYAASIGTRDIKPENVPSMKEEIEKFHRVSVREKDAVEIVKNRLGIDSVQVLDPVFFKSKDEWDKISIENKYCSEKYVLLYGLEENELFENTFKFIKENYNMKIINISPAKKKSKYIDFNLYDVGPREFIGMIKNAEVVFTNSFHGTCFSIIYEKPFFTIGHSELNSRLESILSITGLQSHMINRTFVDKTEFERTIKINKETYRAELDREIQKSRQFLKDSLD